MHREGEREKMSVPNFEESKRLGVEKKKKRTENWKKKIKNERKKRGALKKKYEEKKTEGKKEVRGVRTAGPAFRYIYHRHYRHFTTGNTLTTLVDD